MKLLIMNFTLLLFSNAWADGVYSIVLEKLYTEPVSSSQAMAGMEAAAKEVIIATCGARSAWAQKFIVSVPFDAGDFSFNRNGIPGSTQNPVFVYFSYPKVTAQLEFGCYDK